MQWERNLGEKDEKKIHEQRELAIKGLNNFMMHEAMQAAREGKEPFIPE